MYVINSRAKMVYTELLCGHYPVANGKKSDENELI